MMRHLFGIILWIIKKKDYLCSMNAFKKFLRLAVDHWQLAVAAVFAIAVCGLWYFRYPHLLSTREQSVLFIWDWTYVLDRLAMPLGWMELSKSFVEQFFFNTGLGSAIIALFSLLTLWLTYKVLRLLVRKERYAPFCFLLAFAPAVYVSMLPLHPSGGTEEEMRYDYLVRKGDWQGIIRQYYEQPPQSLACNTAAALAMLQTGQMDQQRFAANLITSKHVLSGRSAAFIMSDVYMMVGLVSLSQRTAFEAMESIRDYNKSGRSLVRLTECSLIYGQPKIALKYISILEKTVFYRRWAQKTKPLAQHPELVESHPVYGKLRKLCEHSTDTFFW